MKTLAAAILALCLCTTVAVAQTNFAEMKQALGEVAGELQQCSVYFLVTATCIEQQDRTLSATYHKAADKIGGLSISTGRSAGLSDRAYLASGSLLAETMMKSMDGNCTNIAVLQRQYMNFCQRLNRDADPRLMEWIKCIHASNRTCNGP